MVLVVTIPLSYHLGVLLLLIPVGFLTLILFLIVMISALVVTLILIFRFNLEHSDLFVTRRLISLRVDYEVVALPQVLHQPRVLFIMTDVPSYIGVRLLFLENVEQRAMRGLNSNKKALIVMPLLTALGVLVKGKFFEIVVCDVCVLAVAGIAADFLLLPLQELDQRVKLALSFLELMLLLLDLAVFFTQRWSHEIDRIGQLF